MISSVGFDTICKQGVIPSQDKSVADGKTLEECKGSWPLDTWHIPTIQGLMTCQALPFVPTLDFYSITSPILGRPVIASVSDKGVSFGDGNASTGVAKASEYISTGSMPFVISGRDTPGNSPYFFLNASTTWGGNAGLVSYNRSI